MVHKDKTDVCLAKLQAFISVDFNSVWKRSFLSVLPALLHFTGLAVRRGLTCGTTGQKMLAGSWYNNSWWGRLCKKVEERRYLCPAHAAKYVDDATSDSKTMSQRTPTETCGFRHLDLEQWELPLYTHRSCACSGLCDRLSSSALFPLSYHQLTNITNKKNPTRVGRGARFEKIVARWL